MNPPASVDTEHALVTYLKGLADGNDRGALAALRRGLGQAPWTVPEMHRHIARYLPEGWGWYHRCLYMVATLFASHPASGGSGNLGDAFRAIAQATRSESIEARFMALLKAHPDDLFDHLRHAVALARSKEVRIDWDRLLRDLRNWNDDGRRVQRDWARAFWGPARQDDAPGPATSNSSTGD